MVGPHLDQTVSVGLPGDVRRLLLCWAYAFHIFVRTGTQTCSTVVMHALKCFHQGPVTSTIITVLTVGCHSMVQSLTHDTLIGCYIIWSCCCLCLVCVGTMDICSTQRAKVA